MRVKYTGYSHLQAWCWNRVFIPRVNPFYRGGDWVTDSVLVHTLNFTEGKHTSNGVYAVECTYCVGLFCAN